MTIDTNLSPAAEAVGAVARLGTPLRPADATVSRKRERRRVLARRVRQGLLAVLVAAGAVVVVLALRPRPVPVDVARATRGPLKVVVAESGKTRVKDRYVVSAPVSGSLSRLILEPGDAVTEGEPLAQIAPALSPLLDQRTRAETEARLGAAQSALGQARAAASRSGAAHEQAAKELERLTRLMQTGSIARQAFEQAEFDVRMRADEQASALFASKVAAEEVRLARATLGREGGTRDRHVDVLAPASGRVLRVLQRSAGIVAAGTPLLEVADPAGLEVVVDLLTTVAVQVKPGTSVAIHDWGGDGALNGRVRVVEPSGFTRPSALGVDEQRVNVVVTLTDPRPRWQSLGDGYRVETRIVLWQRDDVLKIPQGAVFRHGDGWAVYRIDGAKAALADVEIGHRGETEIEVLSGLAPGAMVAVHPGDRVRAGARVEAR